MRDWRSNSDTQRFVEYLQQQRTNLMEELLAVDIKGDDRLYRHAYIVSAVHVLDQICDLDTILSRIEAEGK